MKREVRPRIRLNKTNTIIFVLSGALLISLVVFILLFITKKNPPINTIDELNDRVSSYINDGTEEISSGQIIYDVESYIEKIKDDTNESNKAKKILADIYAYQGDYDKAIATLREEPLEELSNTNKVTTLSRLADYYELSGDKEQSTKFLEEILSLPDNFELEYENITLIKEICRAKIENLSGVKTNEE